MLVKVYEIFPNYILCKIFAAHDALRRIWFSNSSHRQLSCHFHSTVLFKCSQKLVLNNLSTYNTWLNLQAWEAFQLAKSCQKGTVSQLKLHGLGILYRIQLSVFFFTAYFSDLHFSSLCNKHVWFTYVVKCHLRSKMSPTLYVWAGSRWVCTWRRSWGLTLRRARTC